MSMYVQFAFLYSLHFINQYFEIFTVYKMTKSIDQKQWKISML